MCQSAFDFQRMKILGESDQRFLTYIDCATCGSAVLSILSMGQTGLTAQGLLTDLSAEEVMDSDARESLSTDDVLAFHEMLEQQPSHLFSKR